MDSLFAKSVLWVSFIIAVVACVASVWPAVTLAPWETDIDQELLKVRTHMDQELLQIREEMNQESQQIKSDMDQELLNARTHLDKELLQIREEMNQESQQIKSDMDQEFLQVRKEVLWHVFDGFVDPTEYAKCLKAGGEFTFGLGDGSGNRPTPGWLPSWQQIEGSDSWIWPVCTG